MPSPSVALLSAALGNRHVQRTFLVIRYCIDASGGSGQDPALVVGGYYAPESKWSRYEKEWGQALHEAEVDLFHATDFFACEDEFRGWVPGSPKHEKFRRRFAGIAEKRAGNGLAVGINSADYDHLVAPVLDSIPTRRTPYRRHTMLMLGVTVCVNRVCKIAKQSGGRVVVVLEDGPGVGAVVSCLLYMKRKQRVKWLQTMETVFPEGKEFLPLQAADLLSHALFQEAKASLGHTRSPNPEGATLRRLRKNGRVQYGIARKATLLPLVPLFDEIQRLAPHEI